MQKKIHWMMVVLAAVVMVSAANGQTSKKAPFRIVGYYSLQAAMTDSVNGVPFDKLTHINLWFLNPDTTGVFTQDFSALAPFIKAAHAKGVKVLASIGGGSPHPYYHTLLNDEQRPGFVDRLVKVALTNNLDGIDVDLEGGDVGENYEAFVTDLAAALKPKGKLLTAAVAQYYSKGLTDKALAHFDFVNVMSYDKTGPWRPEKPGPHATYAHAVEDLDHFGRQRNLPNEKLVLGVPFYGYGFGPELTSPATSMNYGQIVMQFPGAEAADEYRMPDGKTLYYNGNATIRRKVALAKERASGVMIWQIKGDAAGENSLLQAINEVAREKK